MQANLLVAGVASLGCLLGSCASKPSLPPASDPRACVEKGGPGGVRVLRERPRSVNIEPGESVCFPLDEPAKNLTLQLLADGSGTTLHVFNPSSEVLTFTALVYLEEGEGGYPSTTCPVGAGLTNSEHWPEQAVRISLADFKLYDPAGAPTVCE